MNGDLFRARVRREALITKAGYGLSDSDIVREILSSPRVKLRTNRRDGYASLSTHSVAQFLRGERRTRLYVVDAIRQFISEKRNIPEFVFVDTPEVISLSKNMKDFFRAPSVSDEIARRYEGIYLHLSLSRKIKIAIVVDYDSARKTHFARGKLFQIPDGRSVSEVFVHGYAILKPDVFMVFLRDKLRYDPYIIELPQINYSIAKIDEINIGYSHEKYQSSELNRPVIKLPRSIVGVRRFDPRDESYIEFGTLVEFWRTRSAIAEKRLVNRYYDVFGSRPMFFVGEEFDPHVDRLFDIERVDRRRFIDMNILFEGLDNKANKPTIHSGGSKE